MSMMCLQPALHQRPADCDQKLAVVLQLPWSVPGNTDAFITVCESYLMNASCSVGKNGRQYSMPCQVLWGECISGALYKEDFLRMARQAGFADPRVLSSSRIDVTDAELADVVGNAGFHSITYRLFKLPDLLESLCEDYGQVAVYKVG